MKVNKVSHRAKLTPAQVRKARKLLNSGWNQTRVAKELNVSQSSISMLERGVTYRRVA